MSEQENYFKILQNINVNHLKDKKGKFDYLSWADAVTQLLLIYPDSTWEIHEYYNNLPYLNTESGCYVKVSVTVKGITRTQIHPVLDNYNKPIKNPDCFQINTSIQRALAKAIALHGLGLYIFRGEDLPDIDTIEKNMKPSPQVKPEKLDYEDLLSDIGLSQTMEELEKNYRKAKQIAIDNYDKELAKKINETTRKRKEFLEKKSS